METFGVIETQVVTKADFGVSAILICFQIDLLIFYCPPQPFDEQVVVVAPLSIHADFDPMLLKETGEGLAGELGTLVGVEYVRFPLPEGFFKGFDTEVGIQGI